MAVFGLVALGILLAILAQAASAAEPHGARALTREIDETRDIAAEVSKAVPRVRRENRERRTALSTAGRDLTETDISASVLRLARLDVDAARSRLWTLGNRIEQHESALDLLQRQIQQGASAGRSAPSSSTAAPVAGAEQPELDELRTVTIGLIEGLRQLRQAWAERLVLAQERLALLQSSVKLDDIRDDGGFESDPRVVAMRAVISRLTRDSIRFANQAAAIEPTSTPDRLRKRLLELQANDAIARGTLRLGDLDLLRVQSDIDFLDGLGDDLSIPLRVVRTARQEFDALRTRLDARLAELDEERRALQGRRELIRTQSAEASQLVSSQLESVQSLEELVDFQQADIVRMQEQILEAAERLDAELAMREWRALGERRHLPVDAGRRELLEGQLALMPADIFDAWRRLIGDVTTRLANATPRFLTLLTVIIAGVSGTFWWLYRNGLPWLVARNRGSGLGIPFEAVRRSIPALLPAAVWLVVAWGCGLDRWRTGLIAGALLLWPLVSLVLRAHRLLARDRTSRSDAWGRAALVAAAAIGTAVLVVRVAPMLPSLADVVTRAGFLSLALAAFGTWVVRASLLGALRDRSKISTAAHRFLEVATFAVPALLALAALAGLAGWFHLGWTAAGTLGVVLATIGLVGLLAGALAVVAKLVRIRMRIRRRGDVRTVDAAYRLAVIGLTVGAAWLLFGLYAQSAIATAAFWVVAVACALPFVLQPVEVLVASFFNIDSEKRPDGSVNILAICVDRGVRALLIIGAVLGLAWILDLDLAALASGDSLQARLVGGAFNVALVALVADFIWHFAKTMIDQRLALEGEAEGPAEAGSEGGGQGASRIRTLLPLLRKFLMITLAVMVIMLVLSSLGVDIGPLLAGAGVVGLAIGFGAQTLVRDIVSGVFFLLDDAFRLGEYIDIGSVRGTVEHISIRSLRLRHHRGALHTIPFGEIQHLTNHSRDWVIMKLQFRVPYDTDLNKVKKIFKKIGAEMQADPAIGPNLLQPPKSQGVLEMDDSAMIIRAKFMAKPGEQFIIRRELYHRVQKEFEAAGIQFARRQVSVYVPPGQSPEQAAAAAMAEEEAAADQKAARAATG